MAGSRPPGCNHTLHAVCRLQVRVNSRTIRLTRCRTIKQVSSSWALSHIYKSVFGSSTLAERPRLGSGLGPGTERHM